MISYDQIVEMSEDQGKETEKYGYSPYPLKDIDVDTLTSFPFPNIGAYRPAGWELVDNILVDSSGMGDESEAALTIRGFKKKIKDLQRSDENWGMAIIEAGEFQVVIGLFKPDSRDFTRTGKLTAGELRYIGHNSG